MSVVVQQARHKQIVAPRVIHRVRQRFGNQGGLLQYVQHVGGSCRITELQAAFLLQE